jgi:very-short-patch-repair endonuclease
MGSKKWINLIMKLSRETQRALITRAREMRKNPTKAEVLLWEKLRRRRLGGYKFRRQQVIGIFIVDFYCPSAKVIVEVDGEIHLQQKETDRVRDYHLGSLGYEVLRFRNQDVFDQLGEVLETILGICSQRDAEMSIRDP